MSKIAVGLSGGVDSAVAALLLRDVGHEVVGVHLYCYPPKSEYSNQQSAVSKKEEEELRADWIKKNGCRADEDKQAALKTALELSIPFVTLDFSEEYNSRVVDYFYREYEAGRTPNPDVLCNSEIKFGLFLRWALENGFDYVAMGHYASLQKLKLSIPKDKHKDQTYFLWKLTQKELKRVLFPLSDLLKSEVRKIAMENNLTVAQRKDSQGICFVGNIDVRKFLARRLEKKKGEVKNVSGEVIGTHDGVWFYTIGQRGGWTIDSKTQKLKTEKTLRGDVTPIFYIISKDAEKNELVVGIGEETMRQKFVVGEVNWVDGKTQKLKNSKTQNFLVRIRHGGKLFRANLQFFPQSGISLCETNSSLQVMLEELQRGIAPGQSAVFYAEDGQVLGGGVIE